MARSAGVELPSCRRRGGAKRRGGTPLLSEEGWREAPGWWMRLNNWPALKAHRRELPFIAHAGRGATMAVSEGGQLLGRKFRRQHSFGAFILDFYCPSERLAIELDGAAHDHDAAQAHDLQRSSYLRELGVRVIRFENRAVMENLEGVLATIAQHFDRA